MIGVTGIGIILACCEKLTMNCICVIVNSILIFVISIVLMVFGGLLLIPSAGGKQFIAENCGFANMGQFDQINA